MTGDHRPEGPDSAASADPTMPAPARARHRPGPVVKALMVLTLLGFLAPFIAYALVHNTGNGPRREVFNVTVRNDGTVAVSLSTCVRNCAGKPAAVLTAGATLQVPVFTGGGVTRYYVSNAAGTVLGCLPLSFSRPVAGVSLQISQQVSCPGDPIPVSTG